MKLGTLCYIRNDASTLLLHRNKKKNDPMKGYWIGLGGHIKIAIGETPHECAVREVYEESGLTVEPRLRGIITFQNIEDHIDDWYAYVFSAHEYSGKRISSQEGTLAWVKDADLSRKNIAEGDRMFLQWLVEDRPLFSAKFVYQKKKLKEHSVVFY